VKINIKPLSVNDAWKGRRFRTDEYKAYAEELSLKLKPMEVPDGKLRLVITFGFSSKGSDYDNPIKPFQDVISKYYGFNDNKIYEAGQIKKIVPKGDEYIDFSLTELKEDIKL
jgi:Holliday junction resolvase RusA-like endonuclease